MGKYSAVFNTTNNETYNLSFCHVLNNSWEFDANAVSFKGRPASSMEKKRYNIQKGVVNGDVSIYIYASNLPDDVRPDDKVQYLGKVWTVESVGWYFDNTRFIDASIFDEEYIKARCPKGLTLK